MNVVAGRRQRDVLDADDLRVAGAGKARADVEGVGAEATVEQRIVLRANDRVVAAAARDGIGTRTTGNGVGA